MHKMADFWRYVRGRKMKPQNILVVFQFVSQLISVGLKNNFAFLAKKFPVDYWENFFKTMQILPDFWHLVEGLKNFDKNPKKTAFSTPTTWGGKNVLEIFKNFSQLISEG